MWGFSVVFGPPSQYLPPDFRCNPTLRQVVLPLFAGKSAQEPEPRQKQVNLGQEGDILSFTRALRLANKVYPEHTIDTFEDFFGRALQRRRVKHADGNGIYPPQDQVAWAGLDATVWVSKRVIAALTSVAL